MRRHSLRTLAGIAAAPLLLALLPAGAPAATTAELTGPGLTGVVPTVTELQFTDGEAFRLTSTTRIMISGTDAPSLNEEAQLLAGELVALDQSRHLGMNRAPEIVVGTGAPRPGDIVLQLGTVPSLTSAEGYKLQVDGAVTITGPSDTGVFYGTRTLLQSLASSGGAQSATVLDEPAKPERSLHVDAARKYYSPSWFEQVIRDMASIKLNQLQYHFSENEGFRLESKTHPEIVSDTFITQAELAELLVLAKQYHVDVVPALDVPGHLNQLLNQYPQFRASSTSEGSKVLDYSNPQARALLFEVIDEFAALFPSSRWHMGGDEIFNVEDPSDAGARFPQLLAYAKAEVGPTANIHDGYIHFLNEVNAHLNALGKSHVRAWNDALYGTGSTVALDPNIDVTYWTKWHPSMPTVETIRARGHKVMNFNDGFFYYVLANPGGAYATPRPASDIYTSWRPGVFPNKDWTVPAAQKAQTYPEPSPDWITGSSFAIWSDAPARQTEEQVTAGIRLPLRAMAERVWNPSGSTASYADWLARVEAIGTQPAAADLSTAPALELTKTATATRAGSSVTGVLEEGDEISWQVLATNTGSTALHATVSDDLSDVLDEVSLTGAPTVAITDADGTVVREPGINVAFKRSGTASGQEVANQWGPALAVDGITSGPSGAQGSRWSSNGADNAWLAVELDEPTMVDHVSIYWEEACAAKYRIDVSVDGLTWVPATSVLSPACGSVDRQSLTVTEPVSFVRMQGLDRTPIGGKKYGMSLWEMQVWTGPERGAITNPALLDEALLTWEGLLEPGHTATLEYRGVVTDAGNGSILNTATLSSPYYPGFSVKASTENVLAVDEPTVEPTVESSDKPTVEPTMLPSDESTDKPTVEPSDKPSETAVASATPSSSMISSTPPAPQTIQAASEGDGLASTGANAGTLFGAALFLMGVGVLFILRRRKASHN
ncbi:family 20 glycosylhydrolase [Arthrobacter psychrochitiniphilus]|uniref:family 20 glycosylhydrolase n=1 Tax=Arthrobacter psychrochitiniphilus TaxID=291045 RepID=UPI003F7CB17B